jgi:ABC-type amino acid transport substrate-binding protein
MKSWQAWGRLCILNQPHATIHPPAAGIITSIHLTSSITDRKDLAGKAVGVWDGYANLLRSTEIAAVPLPWENDDDLVAMVDRLRSGALKALLLDE